MPAPGRTTARLVLACGAALAGTCAWYALTYGQDAPLADEWTLVPVLTGRHSLVGLVTGHHNEHRYPLGQLVWYGTMVTSGYDFRAGMVLSVALVAGVALALVRAAARATGGPHPADVLFPALLLNLGHTENWLMGYQVVLTLPLAAVGLLLALAAVRPATSPRSAALAGGLLLVAMTGGAYGFAVVPPLAAWLVYLAVRARRDGHRGRAEVLLGSVVVALAYVVFAALTAPWGVTDRPPWDAVAAARRVITGLGYTLGGGIGANADPAAGLAVLAADMLVAGRLGWVIATMPAERPRAAGLLAVGVGLAGVGVGLAVTRPVFADRYALPLALHGCAAVLAFRLYPLRVWPSVAAAAAVGLAVLVVAGNWRPGVARGHRHRFLYREMRTDAAAGMPVRFLAAKYAAGFLPNLPDRVDILNATITDLRALKAGWLGRSVPTPDVIAVPADGSPPPGAATDLPFGPLNGPGRPVEGVPVEGVRVTVRADRRTFCPLAAEWTTGVRGRQAFVYLLLEAGEPQAVDLWVNDLPDRVRFRTVVPADGVRVIRVEWLLPAGRPEGP